MKFRNGLFLTWIALPFTAAQAHVTLDQNTAAPGTYQKLTFKVGHGCEGSATTSLSVQIPDGVFGAKPMPKAGWTLHTKTEPLSTPYQSHGKTISNNVSVITWDGGNLPDAYYDEFSVQVKLPDAEGKLYFKVTQLCETGRWDWVDIPQEGQSRKDLKAPAPLLEIKGSMPAGHQH